MLGGLAILLFRRHRAGRLNMKMELPAAIRLRVERGRVFRFQDPPPEKSCPRARPDAELACTHDVAELSPTYSLGTKGNPAELGTSAPFEIAHGSWMTSMSRMISMAVPTMWRSPSPGGQSFKSIPSSRFRWTQTTSYSADRDAYGRILDADGTPLPVRPGTAYIRASSVRMAMTSPGRAPRRSGEMDYLAVPEMPSLAEFSRLSAGTFGRDRASGT